MSLGAGSAGAQDAVVLQFPSFQHDEASTSAWWNEIIADFEASHPGFTVDFSNSPGGQHSDLLATRFATNRAPEIVHMISRDFVRFAAQGWFDEIDTCFTDDTLAQFGGLQSFMQWNGQTLGLLLNSYAYHLYYNAAILEQAGVRVPTTLDEFEAAVEAVNALGGDFVGFAGITTSSADAYVEASIFLKGEGLSWIVDDQYALTSPEVVAVLDAYRTILKSAPQGVGEQERNELYFSGRAAMMLDGNYFWQQALDNAEPAVRDHLAMAAAPFPVQAGSVSNSLHIPAGLEPETRAAVCDFIAIAARPDFQAKYGEAISVPPPRDGSISEALRARFPEEIELMIASKADAVSVLPETQTALENYGLFSKLVSDALVEMLSTDRPTDEILADLQALLESEIPLG
jgi:multiple sugar transport system substrate-binding protein